VNGEASIAVNIREFVFKASPKLRQEGNFNNLDFDIHDLTLDIPSDGIQFDHISVGIFPDFLIRPFVNFVLTV